MTPGQGVGANTALRDAAQQDAKPLLAAIGDYQGEMVPYGFARVADSLAQTAPAATTRYTSRWSAGSCWPSPAPISAPSIVSPQ
jgi:hypothetical protein